MAARRRFFGTLLRQLARFRRGTGAEGSGPGRTLARHKPRRLAVESLEVRATPTAAVMLANMWAEIMESAPSTHKDVPRILGLMNADGRFRDLDYGGRSDKSAADLQAHGKRLTTLAKAYHWDAPENAHYHDAALRSQIVQGWTFAASAAGSVNAPNWWWKAIGVPQGMSDGLVLMRDEMTASLRSAVLRKYFGSVWNPTKYDGANLTYQAPIAMIDGLLRGDLGRIRDVVSRVSTELSAYKGEGIQRDLSFVQHKVGKNINWHSGSYGLVFARDTARIMRWAAGSDFAFGPAAVNQHLRYVLDHLAWLTRGHVLEISSQGRSITRPGQITNATTVLRDVVVDLLPLGRRTHELLAFLDRYENGVTPGNAPAGNRQLWEADAMIHQRQNLLATVRMISTRTVRPETAAGENTKGYFLGDGFTMLLRDGEEFGRRGEQEIIPVWDWQRLPGTTVEQTGVIPYYNMFGNSKNTTGGSSLVGSASNGQYGVAAMDYVRSGVNVTARKAWFFFDNELVALGAGINGAKATSPVFTSLNQVLLDGDVTVQDAEGNRQAFGLGGTAELSGKSWIHHDRMGYVLLNSNGATTVQAKMQSGNGKSLPVFSAWVDHGPQPQNQNYAYAVVPDVSVDDLEAYSSSVPFRVLANNRNVQAVRHEELQQTQIAFYAAGKVWISPDTWVSVDQPAMVIVHDLGDALEVTVADPRQLAKPKPLIVETNRRLIGSGAKWNGADQVTRIAFTLPTGQFAGSSVTRLFASAADPITLPAEADAFVRGGSYANNNYGQSPTLYVQRSSAANTQEAFLRFDLSEVQGEIVYAEVRLMAVELGVKSATIAVAEAGNDTWREDLVRWNSKPGSGPEIARTSVSKGKWAAFEVTDQARNAASGDTRLSLRVFMPSSLSKPVGLASREHANAAFRPVLELFVRAAPPAGDDLPEGESADRDAALVALFIQTPVRPLSLGEYVAASRLSQYFASAATVGPAIGPAPLPSPGTLDGAFALSGGSAKVATGDGKQYALGGLVPAAVDATLGGYSDPETWLDFGEL